MSVTCPKCSKGLRVKEIVTNLHRCVSIELSNRVFGKLKRSGKVKGNRDYVRANFDALVAAALKDS
jgi:hypothetical protein